MVDSDFSHKNEGVGKIGGVGGGLKKRGGYHLFSYNQSFPVLSFCECLVCALFIYTMSIRQNLKKEGGRG